MENKKIFELVKGFRDLKNDYENFNNPETIIKFKRDYKIGFVALLLSFFMYGTGFFYSFWFNPSCSSLMLNAMEFLIIIMFICWIGLGLELNQLTFYILQNNKEEFLK